MSENLFEGQDPWESTNLNLREDGQEGIPNGRRGTPRSNNQNRAHRVQGTRLDKHGYDSLGQSVGPTPPHGSTNGPGVQDEPDDDHQGEDDVE